MDFLIQKVYAQSGPEGGGFGLSGPGGNGSGLSGPDANAFDSLLQKILDNIVNPIILLLMALSVIYFLWGVFTFIQNADNADKRQEGYQQMIWGVIGIFIMVSAVGIKNLIAATLGL